MDGMTFWILAVTASLCVGLSKGGLPALGVLGVPILSLAISPVTAAGLLLPIFCVSDMFGLYAYRKNYDRRVILLICIGATAGVAFGWLTAHLVPEWLVTLLIGLIGAIFALNRLLRPALGEARHARTAPGLFWGALTGFTSFISHAGAPPYQVYAMPLRMPKAVFAGTSTIIFAYVNGIKLIPYWFLGQLSAENLAVSAWLALPAVAAVFLGVWLVKIIPERLFFLLVTWGLLLISLRLIWQALA